MAPETGHGLITKATKTTKIAKSSVTFVIFVGFVIGPSAVTLCESSI